MFADRLLAPPLSTFSSFLLPFRHNTLTPPHTHVPDFSLTQTTTTPDHITLHMHDNTYHAYLSVFLPLHFMTFHFILLFFLASLTFFILFLNLSRSLILPRCLAYGAGVQHRHPAQLVCGRRARARRVSHSYFNPFLFIVPYIRSISASLFCTCTSWPPPWGFHINASCIDLSAHACTSERERLCGEARLGMCIGYRYVR